jgi:glycosyltransferase involved in cell wall biosynthesis
MESEQPALDHNMQKQNNAAALVCIGLPVYNGERYLNEAIQSVLEQDFADFELLISDNASTDATWAISAEYAKRDKRVRLHKNAKNVGIWQNFRIVYELSRSRYFMWMSHDDVLEPSYVSRCLEFLEANPDYILCCTMNSLMDGCGNSVGVSNWDYTLDSDSACERYGRCLENIRLPTSLYGLFRSSLLQKTRLFPGVLASDWILMLETCLEGKVYQIKEVLRCYRTKQSIGSPQDDFELPLKAIYGDTGQKELFPWVRFYGVLLSVIINKPLSFKTRATLVLYTFSRLSLLWIMYRNLSLVIKYMTCKRPTVYRFLRRMRYRWLRDQ